MRYRQRLQLILDRSQLDRNFLQRLLPAVVLAVILDKMSGDRSCDHPEECDSRHHQENRDPAAHYRSRESIPKADCRYRGYRPPDGIAECLDIA